MENFTNLQDSECLISDNEGLPHTDIVTISGEDEQLFNVLNKHGLESFFFQLTNAKINIDCFKSMSESDVKDLFKEEIGNRIKFRALVNEWRLENNFAPISTCCCEHMSASSASGSVSQVESVSQVDSVSTYSGSSSSTYKYNLDNFLSSDLGRKILENYKAKNEMGTSDRDILISNIVRDHLQKEVPMNTAMFAEISGDIVKRFSSEKKEYYFEKEKRNGKLYNKYRSMSRAFRKSGYFNKYIRVRKNITDNPEVSTELATDSEDKIWLKTLNTPWETVELKWDFTFELRRQDIKSNKLEIILSEWPLYTHCNGYLLVDIDFNKLHPERTNLFFNNWTTLKDKIIGLCRKISKFPAAKKIINELPSDKDLEFIEIIKVLIAIFKPVSRKIINKKIWKVSTGDAWCSFITEINTASDIQTEVNKRKVFCVSKNINFQPFMIVIKDRHDINSHQYVLVAESLTYLFTNALTAFDIYFKIFFVLNLEYPFETQVFWNFVQSFFYEIPSSKIQMPELELFQQLKDE